MISHKIEVKTFYSMHERNLCTKLIFGPVNTVPISNICSDIVISYLFSLWWHRFSLAFCNWCDSRSIGHHLSQYQRNRFISLHRKSVWFHQFSPTHRTIQSSAVIAIEAKLKRFLFSKYFETLFSRMKSRGWLIWLWRIDVEAKNR